MKNLRVTVDGKTYQVAVEILDESPVAAVSARSAAPAAPVSAPAPAVARAPATAAPLADSGAVLSPLAGKVISVDVVVGQQVAEGAQLATIEAMKMNTYVFAPRAGRVTAIVATAGSPIEEGRPVVVLG